MILTGVQGTGKSILGAIIGLFMAKVFGWQVHYRWKNTDFWFGKPDQERKVVHIVDLSQGEHESYPSGFVLIVSSANKDRWKNLKQQQNLSEISGNYCFINPQLKERWRQWQPDLEKLPRRKMLRPWRLGKHSNL